MTTATLPGLAPYWVAPPPRTNLAVAIPPAATQSLTGFRKWILEADLPPGCRISFLDGEVFIDMSSELIETHSAVKAELNYVLYGLVRQGNLGRYCPDGVLVSNPTANVSNKPDAVFLSTASLTAGRVRFVPAAGGEGMVEIEGSPDMVCEIVSPSSVTKDAVRLRDRYHRAGVTEYWLIDALGDEIVFDLLRHMPDGYLPAPAEDGWRASSVFGRKFRLERSRASDGLWQYTLHTAPLDAAP